MTQVSDRLQIEAWDRFKEKLDKVSPKVWNGTVDYNGHNLAISDIICSGLHRAASLEMSAGMQGAMNDGGAGALFAVIQAWVKGLEGEVPDVRDMRNIAKHMVTELDPAEYAEYQRLHAKYGD